MVPIAYVLYKKDKQTKDKPCKKYNDNKFVLFLQAT